MDIQERLKILKPLVNFEHNEFIFTQILVRRKDNPKLELGVKRLKSYTFYSWEELEKNSLRIQELCDLNNARAYIRLNKQNSVDVSLRCIEEISKNLRQGHPDNNRNVWDSVSGQGGKKDWWVLDLDKEHLDLFEDIYNAIGEEYIRRTGKELSFRERNHEIYHINTHMMHVNETKSGLHLICKAFDVRILEKFNKELSAKQLPTIQIQKDANTILYIGNPTND